MFLKRALQHCAFCERSKVINIENKTKMTIILFIVSKKIYVEKLTAILSSKQRKEEQMLS